MADMLKGKAAIITGAAMGNGLGIAQTMARQGASVALFDLSDKVAAAAAEVKKSGGEAVALKVDITEAGLVKEAVGQVRERFKRIDILVNNAGIYPMAPMLEMSDEVRDKIFDVNIKGTWNCIKAVLPAMIEQKYGKIVNISSVTGPFVSGPGCVAYSATKGAVSGLTRALALELAEHKINVNAICPGFIDTPGVREAVVSFGEDPDEFIAAVARSIPFKRWGTPEEIGDLAVFLASEMSCYLTGTETVIDGGNMIQEMKMI